MTKVTQSLEHCTVHSKVKYIVKFKVQCIVQSIFQYIAQPCRKRIITFEFDTYFCNLEGHGSLNPLEKIRSGFWRNCFTGCPKKASVTDFSAF